MPWISLDDLFKVIDLSLTNNQLAGPVNVVAPEIITNEKFTKELAEAVSRPAMIPVPELLLKTIFGEMAKEMFMSSTRVIPEVLSKMKYEFKQPALRSALVSLLQKKY